MRCKTGTRGHYYRRFFRVDTCTRRCRSIKQLGCVLERGTDLCTSVCRGLRAFSCERCAEGGHGARNGHSFAHQASTGTYSERDFRRSCISYIAQAQYKEGAEVAHGTVNMRSKRTGHLVLARVTDILIMYRFVSRA